MQFVVGEARGYVLEKQKWYRSCHLTGRNQQIWLLKVFLIPQVKRNLLYVLLILSAGILGYFLTSMLGDGVWLYLGDKVSTEDVVEEVKGRLSYDFEKDRWTSLLLLGLKEEKLLQVWGISGTTGSSRKLKEYPLDGGVGGLGPKVHGLDRKTPEGIYRVVELKPNHDFHRALVLNYPNQFDQDMGAKVGDGLKEYQFEIHGSKYEEGAFTLQEGDPSLPDPYEEPGFWDQLFNLSKVEDYSVQDVHGLKGFDGSMAIGSDDNIDELFTMVYEIGLENVTVIVAPFDMRAQPDRTLDIEGIEWENLLYDEIRAQIEIQLGK